LFSGDGGLLMNVQELETAVREDVPLTVVALNNGAYAAEARKLLVHGKPPDLGLFGDPNIEAIATGFGAHALTVRSDSDFKRAADLILRRRGVALIDVKLGDYEQHRA